MKQNGQILDRRFDQQKQGYLFSSSSWLGKNLIISAKIAAKAKMAKNRFSIIAMIVLLK